MKNLVLFLTLFVLSVSTYAQEKKQDTTKVEQLEEAIVKAVRVKVKCTSYTF